MENTQVQDAPKVTIEGMLEKVREVTFFNLNDAIPFDAKVGKGAGFFEPTKLVTICVIVMKNGFVLVGKSACASPENFDKKAGETIAYNDAFAQLWPLEGYLLKSQLSTRNDLAAKCAEVVSAL